MINKGPNKYVKKIKIYQIILMIISFLIAYLIINKTSSQYLFTTVLIAGAFYYGNNSTD